MPSTETLLAIALVLVYLLDSMLFLRIGETVVVTGRGGISRLSFGGSFELGGRRPYLPNPLTPYRPCFRIAWGISGGATDEVASVSQDMLRYLRAIRPVASLATLSAVPIVIVAPLSLAFGQQLVFLASVAATVLLALCGCVLVVLRKKELGLSAWQVCTLVFVALVCLPCSPNLARAVMLQHGWTCAARDLVNLGFEGPQSDTIRLQILAALTDAKRYVSEESPEFKTIEEQIRQLDGCKS